ncbi:type III secretion system export apparatus subunit SctT [Trinickia acidisoli]|uniref:type III secretion system export apparatus subunit SctT n=1 Tax=Trinickia acidisoli TaxID=2767482 RepID=UPI001A8CAE1A|nr:type III secretion system export apparatus subunit SctT [Trinickia acidisoli]
MSDLSLQHIGTSLDQLAILFGLCSVRLLTVMIVLPPTDQSLIQGPVRNGLALLWSSVVAYGQQALMPQLHGFFLVEVAVKEAVIGLVIGFAASTIFWTAESVGQYIDDVAGYNNVQLTNPTSGQQTTLTSTLLLQCVVAAFWLLGGMSFLLSAIYESYRWWPLASVTPIAGNILESFTMHETDSMMQTIAKLMAPIVMILVLVDLGFGIVGKAAQKIDINSLAHAIKGALAVLLVAVLIGVVINQVHSQLALTDISAQMRALLGVKK